MNSAVCTLFEKHFHYGLAGLTNSLCQKGFRGNIYAGYRGTLPDWCSSAKDNPALAWQGAKTFDVMDDVKIHFLPLETKYHLTNYKPDFMLQLMEGPAKSSDSLAYFDPDIVLKCNWSFYERWMSYGVGLVHEIIANDMTPNHPIRKIWEEVIEKAGLKPTRILYSYINGGFCGVNKKYIEYIRVWKKIMETGIEHYNMAPDKFMPTDRTDPFFASDQDAMNIAAMCCESPISELGPDAMDFIHGGWTMSHAVGGHKPWKKNFIKFAFMGSTPSLPDRAYWQYVDGPIKFYSKGYIKVKRISILIATLMCRFYKRN